MSLTASPEDTLPLLRVALVGCGWFAVRGHLPALQRLSRAAPRARGFRVELVALCSRSQASLDWALQRLEVKDGSIKCYTELETLLADSSIDCVDLCLPIPAMPNAIISALNAGKAVLSEKPAAPSPTAALALWNAYASPGVDDAAARELSPGTSSDPRCWVVLENWGRKATVLRVEALLKAQCVGRVT
ncbi:hypothetical protein T484DRAFT_1912720, partial [Baffinella frigidus]